MGNNRRAAGTEGALTRDRDVSSSQPADTSFAAAPTARRINAERIVLFGWSRAILMQLAHPLVAAGVHEHSSFRQGPTRAATRLHQTVKAMLALTFGDRARSGAALEGIRAIHRRVHGTLAESAGRYPAGTRYSAEDPQLVLWVHATLLDSLPLAYERLVAPLTAAERDRYCEESAAVAIALGAPASDVPRTRAATSRYLERMMMSDAIVVSDEARLLAHAVLRPSLRIATGPVGAWNQLLTVGWLPPELRRQYGFSWSDDDERRLARVSRWLRRSRSLMPQRVALWRAAR
jgi:uncharacterized protein (DUF2236 family)